MELIIPKNIVFGYGNDGRGQSVTFITAMKSSKRAKNGLFTIPNEKAFRKKITTNMQRTANSLTDGYILKFGSRSRSRGGIERYFYLKHKNFEQPIQIGYDSFLAIIETCDISHAIIKDKLIWTNKGFFNEARLNEIQESDSKENSDIKHRMDSIEEPRVHKKDLKAGEIYVEHRETGSTEQHIYFGTMQTSKGEFNMLAPIPYYYRTNFDNSLKNKSVFNHFLGNYSSSYDSIPVNDSRFAFAYPLHGKFAFLQQYRFNPRKGLPKLWRNQKGSLYDINIYDDMRVEDVNHIRGILTACPHFAIKQGMQFSDIYGIKNLDDKITVLKLNDQAVV